MTRRVPSTLTRRRSSGRRPGCSAHARWTTASAPSRNSASVASLCGSPRSVRCHRTPEYGVTSGGCRRASSRTSAAPDPGAVSRRSNAVPRLPLAPVTATVMPRRWSLENSGMGGGYPEPRRATRRSYGGPMIRGAHVILYSSDADADREFLTELLDLPAVDAGGGWLILQLPPAEVAVHPAETSGTTELYLVCDDIEETVADLERRGVPVDGPVTNQGWGRLATIRLPGGGRLGVYQARHPTAFDL